MTASPAIKYVPLQSDFKNVLYTLKISLFVSEGEIIKLSKRYPENIQSLAEFRLKKAYFSLLGVIAYYDMSNTEDNIKIKKYLLNQFKANFFCLLKSKMINFNRKVAMIFMRLSFNTCCIIGKIMRIVKWEQYVFYAKE